MPKIPDPTPDQQHLLDHVAQAARDRAAADKAYIDAILACHLAGSSSTHIARAIGVSYQAVNKIISRRMIVTRVSTPR